MARSSLGLVSAVATGVLAVAAACNEGAPASPTSAAGHLSGSDASTGPAFTPETPDVYVPKVKNVLLGLPATDDEVKQIEADPTQMKSLVQTWMTDASFAPYYQAKMLRFFELAFQQTQISDVDFTDQVYPRVLDRDNATTSMVMQNVTESFARTAFVLDAQGMPMTATVTTQQFMMTPALMELYAFLDAWQVDDAGNVSDSFHAMAGKTSITIEAAQGPDPHLREPRPLQRQLHALVRSRHREVGLLLQHHGAKLSGRPHGPSRQQRHAPLSPPRRDRPARAGRVRLFRTADVRADDAG